MSFEFLICPFAPDDLEGVVTIANEFRFWDSSSGRCSSLEGPIASEQFWRLFLLDPSFDPRGMLVAKVGGEIVGALQVVANGEMGYLTQFFVSQRFQRCGIGRTLLEDALQWLRMCGCSTVSCNGYAPYYIAPGIDELNVPAIRLVESVGFEQSGTAVAMGMDLTTEPPEATTRYYFVRQFGISDTIPLRNFIDRYFPYWSNSVLDGLRLGNSDTVLAVRGGEVLGFAQWQNPLTDPPFGAIGRFGPFGVRPDLRSQGIGAAIFHHLVKHARARGCTYLWFGWGGGRNEKFYEREGCRVLKRYRIFSRQV